MRFWDMQAGQELRRISPDSQLILDVTGSNSAQLVPVDYHAIMRELCHRVTRDLTDDERRAYDITDTSPTCLAESVSDAASDVVDWIFAAADMTVEPPN